MSLLSCLNWIELSLCPARLCGHYCENRQVLFLTTQTMVLLLYFIILQTSDLKHVDILALYCLIIMIIFQKKKKTLSLLQRAPQAG